MIIVNYWTEEDYNPTMDGYYLELAAVVNDSLDLLRDVEIIQEVLENTDTEFKKGTMYEISLIRGTIASDPGLEPTFVIDRVIEKVWCDDSLRFTTPLARI